MKLKLNGSLLALHIIADALLFNLAFLVSYYLKHGELQLFFTSPYASLLLFGNVLWFVIVFLRQTYHFSREVYAEKRQPILSFVKISITHFSLGAVALYMSKSGELYSRELIVLHYLILVISGVFFRLLLGFAVNYLRSSGYNIRRYGLIGNGNEAGIIRSFYRERKELGYNYCGSLDKQNLSESEIEHFMTSLKLDYLYCTISDLTDQQIRLILRLAERNKTVVKLIPDFKGFINPSLTMEYHGLCPVVSVNNKAISSSGERITKRIFDLVFSALVMIAGAPVFLVVCVLVRFSSPGPIFFIQERSGQWGRIFKIYKFRTMYVDADKFGMQHSTGDQDPRITPIGRILRKTRLDELPQFFNVLKGDMSVVGPRPLNHYDVDMLMDAASHDFQRILTIPPGITSIGQIKVGYATNINENLLRLKHDTEYLDRYSLLKDIRLIFMTVQVMIYGRGK